MYHCPVCGKECADIETLRACVETDAAKEKKAKIETRRKKVEKEKIEKKNALEIAAKEIDDKYNKLKSLVKDYNDKAVAFKEQYEDEKVSTYYTSLTKETKGTSKHTDEFFLPEYMYKLLDDFWF